jgi:hypothetical protein
MDGVPSDAFVTRKPQPSQQCLSVSVGSLAKDHGPETRAAESKPAGYVRKIARETGTFLTAPFALDKRNKKI